jgi:hypothetical protein
MCTYSFSIGFNEYISIIGRWFVEISFERRQLNFHRVISALNAMQTSVNDVGTDAKTTTVMVLLSNPILEETVVRI